MAFKCDICGKGPRAGSRVTMHGLEKRKGGIGMHTTAITKRRFLPNLQTVRVQENGGSRTRRVCASCIKAGKIVKAGKRA